MKLFLIGLLCLGLAFALPEFNSNRPNSQIQEVSYRPGKEYTYHYDTQIVTGLPQASELHAGFRLSCLARVQFSTYSKVRVVLEKIVLYRINEPVVQWKASERLMPEEFLKELVGEEAATMEHFLQIPFGFEYDEGQVLRIVLEDKETTWSANIKRGFVSLFEMNLEKRFLLDESFPAIKSQLPPHANWYNVFERSTTGDCATLYTVTPNAENSLKFVTKVRDFDRCLNRPVYHNSIFDGHFTQDAKKDNPLINGATLKYAVKGDDNKFLILSVVGESHIVFTPYKNQEHVRTSLNQTLTLKESKFIGREVQEISEIHQGQHKRDTLRMTLPSSPVDCQDPFMPCNEEPKQVTEQADTYSVEKINLHLKMAARNTEELTNEESLQHLRIVKDMLKRSPEMTLKKLWEKLSISKVNPQADIEKLSADIYWNVLPSVGTEAAANVVLDICATDFLMTSNCTSALRSLALRVTPTAQIIEKLIRLTRIGRLTQEVKQSAYLTLGSFGHKLTQHLERHSQQCDKAQAMINQLLKNTNTNRRSFIEKEKSLIENRCSSIVNQFTQSEEKIINAINQLLESPKEESKLLALKSLGNSGLPRSLPILKRFLENRQQPNILRLMAITAHRRIQHPATAKDQAIKTLLKMYLTTTEKSEIRSFAFLIMTSLKPKLPVYETVSMSLQYEKDAQLSGFVYSYLTAFSNSTYRPDEPMKINATAALKFAPELHSGLEHSFMKRIAFLSEEYKRGHAGQLTMIGDISRYMGLALNWETYNYGLVSNMLEIGVNTEGISSFLNKLFGPKGLLTLNKSLFDLLKRGPRDISPQQQIQQIFRKLRIEPRTMPTPHGHVYVKVMGHEIKYIDFSNLLMQIISTGSYPMSMNEEGLSLGLPINVNTMYDMADFQLTLPTEAGLPVSLKLKVMSTVKVNGEVSLKVAPYMLESDRQGQAPIEISAKADLKPKLVAELEASMGLDMFYVKPVVGYRGVVKYNAPVQKEIKIDMAYKRLTFHSHSTEMEKPDVEILLEPFSDFLLITKKNESPVQFSDRRTIYAPIGSRMLPVSYNYKVNALGYELAITGQLPHSVSKFNPIRPMSGRTLLNVFWMPMENAPRTISLYAQQIAPMRSAVSNSYAQTYQHVLTTRPEQYGRDFSRMDESGVQKFDKFGRPLPQSTEEILPYSDPVDIKNKPVNMQQMCNKFQKLFNKPMPFYNMEDTHAIVMLLDASSQTAKRQVQVESVWRYLKDGRAGAMFTRFWRSALPEYDTQDWQMLSEAGITYPFEVSEPKDIFNPKWQRSLMKDLEHLINLDSHKVANQRINTTILSGLEQMNYPAMVSVPSVRIIDSLVPEQLYHLMNISGSTIYNRNWSNYWRHLQPVYKMVIEEERVNVDPHFVKTDMPLVEYLTKVLKVQKYFLNDLQDIISKTVVAHAEMPIIQYIDYVQARTVYMIRDIFEKALISERIQDASQIRILLTKAETNVDSIVSLMSRMIQTVTSVSQRLDGQGKPVIVFKPEILRQNTRQSQMLSAYHQKQQQQYESVYDYEQASYYTTEQQDQPTQQESENFYLRLSLYNLTLTQTNFIEKVQLAISNKRMFDYSQWNSLLINITNTLNIVDKELMQKPCLDAVVRQSLLQVTVQNEHCIQLLQQWKKLVAGRREVKTTVPRIDSYDQKLMTIKEQGQFLGERVAMMYHHDLLHRVVVPNLNTVEFPIYKRILDTKHMAMPELREFKTKMAYNHTNMQKPQMIAAVYNKLQERLTAHTTKIAGIEKALIEMGESPKLYIVSELMDVLHYLKFTTEFATRTLYSLNNQIRFGYQQQLEVTATKIQSLISSLSPIFSKYQEQSQRIRSHPVSLLNSLPIDTRVLDVQDVLVQQKMIKEQIARFVENREVSMEILSKVLSTVTDRCEVLQETLKQNQIQVQSAIEQKQDYERLAISSVWSEALYQQRSLYEAMLNLYKNNRDNLRDVARSTERINSLELEIAQLEDSHEQTLSTLKEKSSSSSQWDSAYSNNYQDANTINSWDQQQSGYNAQRRLQDLTPFEYLPTSITALFNASWGNGQQLDKTSKVQFVASRSVEQIMYLFKQMSSVLRSQDIVSSINHRLSDQPWLADSVLQRFNTYSHLHFIAQAQKEQLPEYVVENLQYIQDALLAKFYGIFNRQPALNSYKNDRVQVMLDISDINKQIDLYLLKPEETQVYQGIPLMEQVKNLPFIQNYRPLKEKFMSFLTFNKMPTQCQVNKDKVSTFDKVSYQLPRHLSQKESLLAADCSDMKSFAITMLKGNTSVTGHIIKILNEDKTVEITPGYLDTEIKVNGNVMTLDENKPIVFSKKVYYDLFKPSLKIVRKGLRVEVSFPMTGLEVIMEGSYVQIKVDELFKRRLCGLCSNFDNQMSWEYQGPTQEIYSSPRLFAQSYIVREEDRHAYAQNKPEFFVQHDRYTDVVSHYRPKTGAGRYIEDKQVREQIEKVWQMEEDQDIDEQVDSLKPKGECQPIKETLIKKRRSTGQVCFSEEPISKCPVECSRPKQKIAQKMTFVCVDALDSVIPQLTRAASHGPIQVQQLTSIQGRRINRMVKHAITCQ